jgi:chromosome segregation ATPase
MSSEEQQPNTQENENDKNKKENQNKLNNIDIKELIKIPFVKELLVKIDVLKNGLLDERKKNSKKIKELEEEIKSKSEQIKTLIQEKNDYEKKESERKKEEELNKNKKTQEVSLTANEEIRKLNEEITNLKFENETYQKKLNGTLIETEDLKHEYKNQIKLLSEKNNSLLEQIKTLKSEKEQLEQKLKEANLSASSMSIREKEHFEALLKEYKKAKEEAIHQMNACLDKCSKLVIENKTYKDSILLHEIDAGKMAQKLAEYKNMIIKMNLRNQIYHVKKVGLVSSNGIDVIFGQDKEGNYVMRIDEKDKIEVINIQDVESVNIVDTKKNKVEINYMYKAKKYRINVIVDELIIDQFVEAYKNFYSESMKNQNKINF